MLGISVENYRNPEVHIITIGNKRLFWVRMYDVQKRLGIKNISDFFDISGIFDNNNSTKDQIRKLKRSGKIWFSGDVYTYVSRDLMSKIIKTCRGGKGRGEKKDEFRSKLGFKLHNITMSQEESIIKKIMKTFPNEEMSLQHNALHFFIDLYFPEHRLAIEVDEKGHNGRNETEEVERKGHTDRNEKKEVEREEK